jgi:hypothetical protein
MERFSRGFEQEFLSGDDFAALLEEGCMTMSGDIVDYHY